MKYIAATNEAGTVLGVAMHTLWGYVLVLDCGDMDTAQREAARMNAQAAQHAAQHAAAPAAPRRRARYFEPDQFA